MQPPRDAAIAWARSGAMALTGNPTGRPLGPPADLVGGLDEIADRLAQAPASGGRLLGLDGLGLLTERAVVSGLQRRGDISCGGGTRLLRGRDGWLAVSLPRRSDVELIPAWLGIDPAEVGGEGREIGDADDRTWASVARAVGQLPVADAEDRGAVLGLALGALPPERPATPSAVPPFDGLPVQAQGLGPAPPRSLSGLVVVDLSSLWAGPLCGRLLADAGATVVKVESTARPDGARRGPPAFFDLMNAGKASVALDFASRSGVAALARLVEQADVVIEASRPRALAQLGLDASRLVASGPRVWVSITGHGRWGGAAARVAFGDDAAVAGGLVAWGSGRPHFCADAIADPCSGLVAAAAVAAAVDGGGRWLIDVAMVPVAAHLAGPTLEVSELDALSPPPPVDRGRARALGADNHLLTAG